MEKRYNPAGVQGTDGRIKGTASVTYDGTSGTEYQLWEGTVERIAAGAFDEHLRTSPDVVALFNHDANFVLGRTPDTLKLRADKRGLHYEVELPDTQFARDLQTSIARGDVRGSSFAFLPSDVEWQRDGSTEVRLIKRAKVYDVSPVVSPAYGGTSVGVRSDERHSLEKERDDYRARLETEKRLARLDTLTVLQVRTTTTLK